MDEDIDLALDGEEDPALGGPYSATENGRDAFGHAMNASGRCEFLNGSGCPRTGEQIWDPEVEPDGRN
jgi:hypothetical protein